MTARGPGAARRWNAPRRRVRPAGTSTGDRSAALVVRVWLEDGARVFRGRLTTMETSPGGRGGEEVGVAVVATPRDAADAVRAWLDQFVGDPASDDGDG
ncbi:hypothetical protein [Geodermatophilus sp. SYSU D01119]